MAFATLPAASYDDFARGRLDELRAAREEKRLNAVTPPIDASALLAQVARVEQALEQRRRDAARLERARVLAVVAAVRHTPVAPRPLVDPTLVPLPLPPPAPPPVVVERSLGSPPGRRPQLPPAPPADSAHTRAAARVQALARGAHVRAALRARLGAEMAEQLREVRRLLAEVAGKRGESDELLARQLRQQLLRQKAELLRYVSQPLPAEQPRARAPIRRAGALVRTPRPAALAAGGADAHPDETHDTRTAASRRPAVGAAPSAAAVQLRRAAVARAARAAEDDGGAPPPPPPPPPPLAAGPSPAASGVGSAQPSPPLPECAVLPPSRRPTRAAHAGVAGVDVPLPDADFASHPPPPARHEFLRRRSTNPPISAGRLDWSHVRSRTACRLADRAAAAHAAPSAQLTQPAPAVRPASAAAAQLGAAARASVPPARPASAAARARDGGGGNRAARPMAASAARGAGVARGVAAAGSQPARAPMPPSIIAMAEKPEHDGLSADDDGGDDDDDDQADKAAAALAARAPPLATAHGRTAGASNRLSLHSVLSSRSCSRRDSSAPSGSELPDSLTVGELRHWCGILVANIENDMMETEQLREQQSAELPAGYRTVVPRIELSSRFWLYEDVLGSG
ncbi:hypothetical protein KFE25_010097 [Diacronema lutheri]|uniref:Uncharacterized protein n=1 Tax=Diacronema lutheri TaxID=2081491 RepID=A0A8J5XJZ5_DIALT|nr:hypothetical protein KFE25_010097 [Diacronema lutheri]